MLILAFFDTSFRSGGDDRWRRLREARPASRRHYPLNRPSSLGDYDLGRPEQVAPVVALARQTGIDGFVIDCQWQEDAYRHDASLLADFCRDGFGLALRWRNGAEAVWADSASPAQQQAAATAFAESLRGFPARLVGGAIPVIVEDPKQWAAPAATIAVLRQAVHAAGLPGLYLIANRAEDKGRFLSAGFDALIDPAPDQWHSCRPSNKAHGLDVLEATAGLRDSSDILDRYFPYLTFTVARMLNRETRGKLLPRVFPAFHDWLAHPDGGATQLTNHRHRPADPYLYGLFIENAMLFAERHFPVEQQMMFLQSWNGWLDGSQIEPSILDGDLLLNATRDAIDRGRYMIRTRSGAITRPDEGLRARIAMMCDATRATLPVPPV